ncbi:50S ribosomal protein L24 [Mycobacteroides abscessus MAB_091912_2446]|uniref:50S ribosomal protein L24 n=1 Tax=Mycobacteroides abscessus MAB_091912_2446 TaxID=1335414 RepID=A0A829MME7_9MYCO|nr:50S ribosomal protein L24 [Mycobacteroides abscessus MAB_091912_2446]
MKVHKGDTVLVIAGKDKGAKGKVIAAYPSAAVSSSRASTGSRSTPPSRPTSAAHPPAAS